MINVLEHIQDDDKALALVARGLEPGGRAAILVPAFELLYSRFDAARLGTTGGTGCRSSGKVERAGLDVVQARYLNSAGFLAWWIIARLLKLTPTTSVLSTTYGSRRSSCPASR